MVLSEAIYSLREFLDTGGQVLLVIGVVTCLMWILILERFMFFFGSYKQVKMQLTGKWQARSERHSWQSIQIRQAYISRINISLNNNLPYINAFVALCPLLGLLGTVTGMIEVFNVMAITGSGSARSMASGVSKATIPTMAGMVAALSGVFASTYLQRKAKREVELLEDTLLLDH